MAEEGEGSEFDSPVDLYDQKIQDFDRWAERKEEIKDRSLGKTADSENVIAKRFDDAVETAQNHDDIVESTITAFGPRSEVYQDTGWKLLGVEPLYERDPAIRNPDVLIGHDDHDFLVMVECKTGLSGSQNVLTQIREQAEVVLDHADYLKQKTGCSFSDVERVLCVPGKMADQAVRAIEQEEKNENPDVPIYLWKLYRFMEETIQLHIDFSTRSESASTHNSELTRKLRQDEGVAIAEAPQLTPEFFPESNPYVIMETVFSEVLVAREDMEGSVRKFTRHEVYDYIDDQRTVPHYDVDVVAEMICDDLLEKLEDFGLIEQSDPESGMGDDVETYAYSDPPVSGQSAGRILSNLREGYRNEWIERKAEYEAKVKTVKEFREEHSSLDKFADDE